MGRPGQVLALLSVAAAAPLAAGWATGAAPLTAPPALRSTAALLQESSAAAPLPDAAAAARAARQEAEEVGIGAPLSRAARAVLAAVAAGAAAIVIAAGAPSAARAEGAVEVFFGQGCFWHVQHEIVQKEVNNLGRSPQEVTALSGYAGGLKAGDGNRVCYHNLAMAPDYGQMGHTEVVNVSLPESKIGEFAKKYFDDASGYRFGRADPQDRGGEYRSAIGLPGGMDSPLFSQIEAANAGRMKLIKGEGNDPDTVATKKVWIYDSNKFPFHQGEVYHQFHDDMLDRYSQGYHEMKGKLLQTGTLKKVECPEMGF